jgi:hypothetical protein
MEADFCFVPQKVFFYFWSAKIGVFCEAAIETRNRKLGKTPHINSRPLGYAYQLSFCCGSLQRYIFNFVQSPIDFGGTGVVLHFSAKNSTFKFLAKNIFGSATRHLFTKLSPLWGDSAPPGHEREFSCIVISCGSRIERN